MTDTYDAGRLEADLNATVVAYRRWLNNRDQWTGFDDDAQRARISKLADDVAGVVQQLTAAQGQAAGPVSESDQDEFVGKVERGDSSFETYAYFEEGQFVVADDDDEEWVANLIDLTRQEGSPGILFPDNDGSDLRFIPKDPDAFYGALAQAQEG